VQQDTFYSTLCYTVFTPFPSVALDRLQISVYMEFDGCNFTFYMFVKITQNFTYSLHVALQVFT